MIDFVSITLISVVLILTIIISIENGPKESYRFWKTILKMIKRDLKLK